jgi:hypothetical protein
MFLTRLVLSFVAVCALAINAHAQVTTGSLSGKIQNAQQEGVSGASIIAIHLPSGTTYETTSRADGRFVILNMRLGGPYSVTVAYTGTGTAAFAPETVENVENQPRRCHRPQPQRQEHRGHRNGDGHCGIELGVQLARTGAATR